ncbi:uncharacterized protein LACBIDRAFT_317295 [Laccaria bicolor S238N-H82]|uniref:Predicted protein n=1 Tax=Laccaria bicolor (strain S238N-H82 / ATCC MYA-4686) TaxID=486041 RepID=B0D4V0_LACBS|nr:uncharacterized protein LACBIDRAFT_317295 [Laccaria bicolor S238N-H82]EDR10626.1 predicted protein [Laccaria bicolor S238N-H82]|eukprot:XP_001879076.1 predicted protein [Laccaria bicolor S238N-H82]
MQGSATIPPGSNNLHTLLSITYIALLCWLSPCSIAFDRHMASIIHPETPHRHPGRVFTCPTNLRSRHTSLYGANLPFLRTILSATLRQLNVSRCSFLAGWLILRWR